MSTYTDDPDDTTITEPDDDDSPVVQMRRSQIRQLERKASRADEADSRASRAERELAVFRAGLGHLSARQVSALLAAHEGEMTPDGLKATAADLGWGDAPAQTTEPPSVPTTELATHQRMADAAAGATPPPEPELEDQMRAAETPQAVMDLAYKAGLVAQQ